MDLIDLKRTAEDKAKEREAWDKPTTDTMEDYPYGLTIHLDAEQIEKLGLTSSDLDAGQPVMVMAQGMISEDSVRTYNGVTKRSMTIQLQKMTVSQEATSLSMQERLYGGK